MVAIHLIRKCENAGSVEHGSVRHAVSGVQHVARATTNTLFAATAMRREFI